MNFNIDISSDRTKAIIVIIIFFLLALYNFYSIPADVLQQMKDKLNMKTHRIYAHQNRMVDAVNTQGVSSVPSPTQNQSGGYQGTSAGWINGNGLIHGGLSGGGFFSYLDQTTNNRLSPWDQVQNQWDPIRLHDRYNAESNPIVYQGFGIPLMSDLMCSSFAGINKSVPNGNDRAVYPRESSSRNVLGTIPSDQESMFYFSDNISAPECCPGPYSSDAGCICSFEKASFPLNSSASQYK